MKTPNTSPLPRRLVALGIPLLLLATLGWLSAQLSPLPPATLCLEVPSPRDEVRGVGDESLIWHKNRVSVKWLGGTPEMHEMVEEYASQWEEHCPVRFNFGVRFGSGDIRIDFRQSGGSWSYVGIEATKAKGSEATMNLAISSDMDQDMIRRVVLHEFGHALGLRHEHRSPNKPFDWNIDMVMATYTAAGWSEQKTIMNVLQNIQDPNATLRMTEFDPDSIMLYPIPAELTNGAFASGWNLNLSAKDKEIIGELYGVQ